jgi:hypothetical protein
MAKLDNSKPKSLQVKRKNLLFGIKQLQFQFQEIHSDQQSFKFKSEMRT